LSLKSKKCFRYDEMCIKIQKISCPYISSPLSNTWNQVLSMGIFSDRLKYAIKKPLFKNGNKHDVSNTGQYHF
jgi:hypothetical protein